MGPKRARDDDARETRLRRRVVVPAASVDPTVFASTIGSGKDVRVAYQGVPGAYSEGAALAAAEKQRQAEMNQQAYAECRALWEPLHPLDATKSTAALSEAG